MNSIRTVPSSYAKPNSTISDVKQYGQQSTAAQLDSMLGTLQQDMNRQGVTATQKGCCNSCEKPIVGQVITALGKTWHPEHFTCFHCKQELGTRNFFERDSHPYCELDYHNLFSPRCAYCNGPILDVSVLLMFLFFCFAGFTRQISEFREWNYVFQFEVFLKYEKLNRPRCWIIQKNEAK